MENLEINFEEITIRQQISSRGGGIEIELGTLGYPGQYMSAYQNYLGGGLLGRVCSDCTIPRDQFDDRLNEVEDQLKQYFFNLTNPDTEWESQTYEQNQNMPISGY